MGASIFSFLMSLIWCSIFLIIAIIWNKTMMLKHGTGFALAAIAIGIGRLFLPLDLPVSVIIRSTSIMPTAQRYFDMPVFNANGIAISKFDVLLAVWLTGSTIYLIWIITSLLLQKLWISKMELRPVPIAKEILEEIVSKSRPGQKFEIFESDDVKSPMLTGYFIPIILYPSITLSEKDTKYVLLHEWNHFLHKHLWIKLIFNIFCAILWWNPLVYMAKSDLDYILEVNCDRYVIRELEQNRRSEYVAALAEVIKQLNSTTLHKPRGTVGFIGMVGSQIVKRCELILCPPKVLTKRIIFFLSAALLFLFVCSYSVVLQTAYMPPPDSLGFVEVSHNNSFLRPNTDGSYDLYVGGQFTDRIDPKTARVEPYCLLQIK